jgi:uncharacterized membrane protein YadS
MIERLDSETPANEASGPTAGRRWMTEDWWAVVLGLLVLAGVWTVTAVTFPESIAEDEKVASPLLPYAGKLDEWDLNPVDVVYQRGSTEGDVTSEAVNHLPGLLAIALLGVVGFGAGKRALGTPFRQFAPGFLILVLLAFVAMALAVQSTIKAYNLEYALWALVMGITLNLVFGTPAIVRPALATEFYIKTGLVLLGAELLIPQLISLGVPGFCVAWIVAPTVFVMTYIFGQKVLKIESRSLNLVISADMSVCGVSAAIATAAACKAKKEELSLAIGISLAFTVLMMAVMPAIIRATGMSEVLGGAWIGGTIDSTGAVAVAGKLVGDAALEVATTVKLLQNVLIGFIAFGVAVYWVRVVERKNPAKDVSANDHARPSAWIIWERFPKFIFGFFAASALATLLVMWLPHGAAQMAASKEVTKSLMTWFFAIAFISIGLEIDFAEFRRSLKGGKPLVLYVCGQALNLVLTFAMAWVMFEVIFADQVRDALTAESVDQVSPK